MRESQLIARSDAARQAHDGRRTCLADRAEPCGAGRHGGWAGPEVGCGHLLHPDGRRLAFAVVLDLFSRSVVGWATKRNLAVKALRRALVARNPAPRLVHHSDRGSQDCSVDYQALLRKRGIQISMSGRGNC